MSSSVLVSYFSRAGGNLVDRHVVNLPVGNSEVAAQIVARLTGGDLFRIETVRKYPEDFQACADEAQEELRVNARPELAACPESIGSYDSIVLCYPNWWGTVPMPVCAFLERYDFTDRTVLPLCTNEGSGMGQSEEDIRRLCLGAAVQPGLAIRGSKVKEAEKEIAAWLKKHGL
jgi:flavodoxin